ncbi:MAG: right-handed parallel beta-helix repeat-containing protein [Phycisphaerales bacterium]
MAVIFTVVSFLNFTSASVYFVDPNGSNSNLGTIDQPFQTIPYAVSRVVAGDTIYIRAGTHPYSSPINISKIGNSAARFYMLAYNGERPILDFSAMAENTSNRGIKLSGNYWYIKGIDVYNAGDNGMHISGSYNTIEFCRFYENSDSGLQISNGGAYNNIINCDSFYNADSSIENADGFAPKLDVGTGNYFYGCRAWQNLDDGYDGYLDHDDVTTTYENCWAFKNGYLKNGSSSGGDGNGFKMSGNYFRHNVILINCLAFQNLVKGFDQNHNTGSMTLQNCTALMNISANYNINESVDAGCTITLTNCVMLSGRKNLHASAIQITNSWQSPFTTTVADFLTDDPTAAYGPRNADGSLPNIPFMHLALGSDLIDGGTDIGLPFADDAPDLGAYEFIHGDCVLDGSINYKDLQCLASNWLTFGCAACNGADFDGDHNVTFDDFTILADTWLKY